MGQQQREQPQRLRLVGHQLGDDRGEPERLGAERAAHVSITGAARVPLVEDEVDDIEHGLETCGERFVGRHPERNVRGADLGLGARKPLRHRGLGHEERMRDLRGRQAAEQPQGERDLRFTGKRWMAAGRDQPQPLVRHARGDRSLHGRLVLGRRRELRELRCARP
jgi:hypothetical protein